MSDEITQAVGAPLERQVRPRTKDELMAARWRSKTCAPYDNPGTVRTGREWFNRYMLHPWERGSDFELVA